MIFIFKLDTKLHKLLEVIAQLWDIFRNLSMIIYKILIAINVIEISQS